MPLFKIHTPRCKKILIKAENVSEIIETAISKFQLDGEDQYKIALEDGTEIDDDDIIIQLANTCTTPLLLTIWSEKLALKNINALQTNIENNVNVLNVRSTENRQASPSTSKSKSSQEKSYILNMEEIWSKVPNGILEACKKGDKLLPKHRQSLNRVVADYMMNEIKATSRAVAEEIAHNICETYPLTFKDIIGNEQWGSGIETLRQQIYNCVQYMKHSKEQTKRSLSPDSDDADNELKKKEALLLRRQDEYGCVKYAPKLPSTENCTTQEAKRLRLIHLFNINIDERDSMEISRLMEETYCTQRAVVNAKNRDLQTFSVEWPFLKDPDYLIQHSCTLLGKDVCKVWADSLNKKIKPLRQYLKFCKRGNTGERTEIINNCKVAVKVRKDEVPKILVTFKLLINYFQESENLLFKIISVDCSDADAITSAPSQCPILIIRGTSLYDKNATCTVVINQTIIIFCDDALQGILITILSYFVFGICYPQNLEKTLEFIQRMFLNINPPSGGKRSSKSKRKGRSFDTDVFTLAKAALTVLPENEVFKSEAPVDN